VPSPRRPHALVWTPQRVEAWQQTGERPAVAVWTVELTATFLSFVAHDRPAVMWWLIALTLMVADRLCGSHSDDDLSHRWLSLPDSDMCVGGRAALL
jgi:hypothetical protein